MKTNDPTEQIRREQVAALNAQAAQRAELLKRYPKVWDTSEMQNEFTALGFMAPFVVVQRKSDGKKGSLEFQHSPRFYFNFVLDE
jgi:hypothetical protein